MAFEPTLPSAEDWLRDPIFSWQRLVQAFNFKLDQYKAGSAQIPLLERKLAAYDLAIQRMPAGAGRQNLAALLQRFRAALSDLKSRKSSLEGKIMDGIAQLRAEGSRLGAPASGIGITPIAGAALVGAIGLVLYGMTQWLTALANVVAQEKSVGSQIAAYAARAGFSAEETQNLLREASNIPDPRAPKDFFGSLADMLPWALGIAALIYFGPTVAGLLKPGRRAA